MWFYNDQVVETLPDDCVGFVYLITNLTNNRKYVGKKLAKFSKTTYRVVKLKNGTKKRKKIKGKVDSDWKTYYGSSVELSADIAQLGADNFKREILHYCNAKAVCSYIEAKEQFDRKVLESADYYNGIISLKVHKNHIKDKL
jgi:hypothetical protein